MSRSDPFAAMDYAGLFAAIVNSVDAVVIAKALDGTVLSWNPAAERILGWFGTATDITGRRAAERQIELLLMEVNQLASALVV